MSSTSRIAQRPAGRDNTPPMRERDIAFLQARAIDPAVAAERGYRTAPGTPPVNFSSGTTAWSWGVARTSALYPPRDLK